METSKNGERKNAVKNSWLNNCTCCRFWQYRYLIHNHANSLTRFRYIDLRSLHSIKELPHNFYFIIVNPNIKAKIKLFTINYKSRFSTWPVFHHWNRPDHVMITQWFAVPKHRTAFFTILFKSLQIVTSLFPVDSLMRTKPEQTSITWWPLTLTSFLQPQNWSFNWRRNEASLIFKSDFNLAHVNYPQWRGVFIKMCHNLSWPVKTCHNDRLLIVVWRAGGWCVTKVVRRQLMKWWTPNKNSSIDDFWNLLVKWLSISILIVCGFSYGCANDECISLQSHNILQVKVI